MKRLLFIFVLILALCLGISPFGQTAMAADVQTHSWEGTWSTNWGDLILVQTGSKVSGTYTFDEGRISGTVSGNTFTGTWSQAPNYAPPNDAGDVEFVMSEDGKSITGKWRYGSTGAWDVWDGGVRTGEFPVATPVIEASSWASADIQKALGYGLVPDSVTADYTMPITREEFAELSVMLYEKYTGKVAAAAPDSTFSDTKNPSVLKAYQLGIVNGGGNGKFDPKALTNREQIAAMLNRAVKVIAPATDFSITGAPSFSDERSIAPYFIENVKFMSKNGFIKGSNGSFEPKGTCTREMAVLITVRVYEYYK